MKHDNKAKAIADLTQTKNLVIDYGFSIGL